MLDASLVLYIGLIVLAAWRLLFMWRCCGVWLEYANYCVLLYVLLLVLLVYGVFEFVKDLLEPHGKHALRDLPGWLRPGVVGAPIATSLVYLVCGTQTLQHIAAIRRCSSSSAREAAGLKHDRVVQIVAMPAVYSVMAMNSLTRVYQSLAQQSGGEASGLLRLRDPTEASQYLIAKSENCFWVGDLYESWALYQFGRLSLGLIKDSIAKMTDSPVQEIRDSAAALLNSHSAVESLAWLGVGLFVVVCSVQAGWSLYLLSFTSLESGDWSEYNLRMAQFSAAGMVASMGAIYNVHTVQHTFHQYLETYNPMLKFITVKILVTFAFFQKGIVWILRAFKSTLPGVTQKIIQRIPLFGDILNFSEVQFEVFYSVLIAFECLVIALTHIWAWSPYEPWYDEERPLKGRGEGDLEAIDEERQPLLSNGDNKQAGAEQRPDVNPFSGDAAAGSTDARPASRHNEEAPVVSAGSAK